MRNSLCSAPNTAGTSVSISRFALLWSLGVKTDAEPVILALFVDILGTAEFCRLQLRKSNLVRWFWTPHHLCFADIIFYACHASQHHGMPLIPCSCTQFYLPLRSTLTTAADILVLCCACIDFYRPLSLRLKKYHKVFGLFVHLTRNGLFPHLTTRIKYLYAEACHFTDWLKAQLDKEPHGPHDISDMLLSMKKMGENVRYLGRGKYYEVNEMRSFFFDFFARKSLSKDVLQADPVTRAEAEENLPEEAVIWRYLQQYPHEHIATLRADHTADSPPSIDYYPVGERDLDSLLKDNECLNSSGGLLMKRRMMSWFGCAKNIIQHLHEEAHVLHNDIKATNFIILGGFLYLIDFSTSKILKPETGFTYSGPIRNSEMFRAPECKWSSPDRVSSSD
jgi:Protein kinase domain